MMYQTHYKIILKLAIHLSLYSVRFKTREIDH